MKSFFRKALLALLLPTLACCILPSAAAAENSPRHALTEEQIARELTESGGGAVFPIGAFNENYARHFSGDSYVAPLAKEVSVVNVTFVRGSRTAWHIHHGSCQILLGVAGKGAYQIWGDKPRVLKPGESVAIPAGVKHWHGAAPERSFQHVVMMESGQNVVTEWLEPVDERILAGLEQEESEK